MEKSDSGKMIVLLEAQVDYRIESLSDIAEVKRKVAHCRLLAVSRPTTRGVILCGLKLR
jgi:hypothetical protein